MKLLHVFLLFAFIYGSLCDEFTHRYKANEDVIIWVNKVGPYYNPQETYMYHALPYCRTEDAKIQSRMEGLGEALQGYELRQSGYKIQFGAGLVKKSLCTIDRLSEADAEVFELAIKNQYWYELFCDDLPIWGMVGDVSEKDPNMAYIYTHKRFVFGFNGDRIIEVKLIQEDLKPVVAGVSLEFVYSAEWHPSEMEYEHRFDKYLDDTFFEHQIHWFSIFNSFMMVVFLVGLVSMILMRTLKKDFARFAQDDDDEAGLEVGDEAGWKQVKGDVFRSPSYLLLFSSLYGTGIQLASLVFLVVTLSVSFYHSHFIYKRGSLVTAFIGCYAITSFVSGYVSGSYYIQHGGKQWIKNMFATSALFPGVCFILAFFLDFIAMSYGSLASIPLGTMFVVLSLWVFFTIPLTAIGSIVGRNWNGQPQYPCRINPVPHPIPEKKWFQEPSVHILLGGVLPFGSIFIEMYFVFTAFWQYKYYYVFGFLLLVFLILAIVSICVTIVSTYFLLNSEDYRWHWVSFLSSASTSLYVFVYAVYYFLVKTRMFGFLQTCFYFGYTLMFCVGLGIMCGSIGYFGTSIFVRRIFSHKLD
eukprot:TRINITY_DN887_c0_g1_i1.p1 TRINITY_DN887_c0_g1~~TRINITY_DN887_c0_g1_i1.p1  ORF type:complete len:583 (-),score=68.76 TRINITY_DN887_c0_g1_i1:96-1844(-)